MLLELQQLIKHATLFCHLQKESRDKIIIIDFKNRMKKKNMRNLLGWNLKPQVVKPILVMKMVKTQKTIP